MFPGAGVPFDVLSQFSAFGFLPSMSHEPLQIRSPYVSHPTPSRVLDLVSTWRISFSLFPFFALNTIEWFQSKPCISGLNCALTDRQTNTKDLPPLLLPYPDQRLTTELFNGEQIHFPLVSKLVRKGVSIPKLCQLHSNFIQKIPKRRNGLYFPSRNPEAESS